jgi:pyridoxamine 5'-phosphate oxidase
MNSRVKNLKLSVYIILTVVLLGLPFTAHAQTKPSFQDCVKFANEEIPQRICSFATTEGDQPHVRILSMCFADEKGFYFQTESVKSVYKQLQKNNKVELCFLSPKTRVMMRVTGKVEFLDDPGLKSKIYNDRPYLKNVGIKGPDDPLFVIFRVGPGEAWFWTMSDSMKEAQIERIKF